LHSSSDVRSRVGNKYKRTGRTRQAELIRKTGKAEQGCQDKTARAGQLGDNRKERTARTGQLEEGSQKRTSRRRLS
jgi:hypothetical protein